MFLKYELINLILYLQCIPDYQSADYPACGLFMCLWSIKSPAEHLLSASSEQESQALPLHHFVW
jgi:hypothetical protein